MPQAFEVLMAAGEVELVGEMGQDWLGVPLMSEGRTLGRHRRADVHAGQAADPSRTWRS